MIDSLDLPEGHRISLMQRDDIDKVYTLESSGQQEPWGVNAFANELENQVATVDLYWCGQELSGFLCSWLIVDELQIQNLVTSPSWRRQGIAVRLLDHVLNRSRLKGLASAWLEVRAGNSAAVALYKRLGFKVTGRRTDYYHDGEDALLMTYHENAATVVATAHTGE